MQTEPEQWAVELDEQATLAGNKAYVVCEGDDVERGRAAERARQLTIQLAFEERLASELLQHRATVELEHLAELQKVEERERKLREAVQAYHRLLGPIAMTLAERELIDEPLADETVLFSFSGSGASDWTTIADFRKADELARQALKETPDAG